MVYLAIKWWLPKALLISWYLIDWELWIHPDVEIPGAKSVDLRSVSAAIRSKKTATLQIRHLVLKVNHLHL